MAMQRALIAAGMFMLVAGCGDDGNGNDGNGDGAYLTIVGDDDLDGDPGATTALTVRYHDAADRALTGTITFGISGDPMGSTLSRYGFLHLTRRKSLHLRR